MSCFHLHNKVRKRRKAAGGLTQQELASLVGVTRQSINAIERGRSRPGVDLALEIAHALSCKVEDLFEIRQDGSETDEDAATGAVSPRIARPPA